MKKFLTLLSILIVLVLSITACGDDTPPTNEDGKPTVNVAVLSGTTGFGMAHLMEQNANNNAKNDYKITIETKGEDVIKQLLNESVDIAALPTNAASTVYNKTQGGVKILAINTLGVLYVLDSGSSVETIADLEGKTIYAPAQNPSFIMEYILRKNNINATVDSASYAEPAKLRDELVKGNLPKDAIVVLPEPMVTIVKSKMPSIRVALDLTEEWNKVETNKLVQGCVVVRTEFLENNKAAVDNFIDEYKASIEYLNNNVNDGAKLVAKHKIFENENVAKAAIPKCNITFIDGTTMKAYMSDFLKALKSIAPASIGNNLPNDDFYYIK